MPPPHTKTGIIVIAVPGKWAKFLRSGGGVPAVKLLIRLAWQGLGSWSSNGYCHSPSGALLSKRGREAAFNGSI